MIISRTPFRVSFFGGGSDYKEWYQEHGGAVLSSTIDYYCYINCRRLPQFFDYKNRIVWSKIETVNGHDDISHPVVREVLRHYKLNGVEIHHDGDLPSRTGLGSSSSFTVGILNSVNRLLGRVMSKKELATEAINIERDILGENVGIQDQIAASYGGLNRIDIRADGTFNVQPVQLNGGTIEHFQNHLMLFYSGTSRIASTVAGNRIRALKSKQSEMTKIQDMVDQGQRLLFEGSFVDFGYLMHESWCLKRDLTQNISTPLIDYMYDRALENGAVGGKLLGAGGGGFVLFVIEPAKRDRLRLALKDFLEIPVKFESTGTEIIFDNTV